MYAVILAGGFGTRLRSAVSDVPKPLAPVGGRPFIAWMIDFLAREGVSGVTLSVHHEWRKIRDYFSAHPAALPVEYAVEETPLGTGGAMGYALSGYKGKGPVLVLNGDSFVRADYRALYRQHQKSGASLTMVLRAVPDTGRYGRVVEEEGVITAFAGGEPGRPGLINAGVYVMQPDIFLKNPMPQAFSFERDFLPSRIAALKPRSFHAGDYFIDIGIPEDYVRACRELPDIFICGSAASGF
jgi:D-glycero-alpha-D-manno-heptose 1-phosphate guanylyltransferase